MITRRDFLKATGVGAGAIALPSWFILPEPATDIQKYFSFLECDGRILIMASNYDAYELTSYIWCGSGKKPKLPHNQDEVKYYHKTVWISGMLLYQAGIKPKFRDEAIEAFQKDIKESRNDLEAFIKKELGDRNIWVFDNKEPYDFKLLKRI